jgi:hypothetical protein
MFQNDDGFRAVPKGPLARVIFAILLLGAG